MYRKKLILFLLLLPLINFGQQKSIAYQVNFERNKYELSAKAKQLLSFIYESIAEKSNYIIYINGHTDNDADSSYNQLLSLQRSSSVKDFFIEKGIRDSLLRVQAMGEKQPLVENNTPFAKAKNRRVEIIVLFQQISYEKDIKLNTEESALNCNTDTTVGLESGYKLTLSKCEWERNKECLRVDKEFKYEIKIKENWLKKHLGFKNYKKEIKYKPHYNFYVVACEDSCFQKSVKLYISQYKVPKMELGVRYFQKKDNRNGIANLMFKEVKMGDSAYYVTNIYCPGILRCGTDNRCNHLVNLYAKNKISILSYSYYDGIRYSKLDTSLVKAKPLNSKRIKDNYRHTFFETLNIIYKADTIALKNIPIDIFAHGAKKIKSNPANKSYFLFIPYRKARSCGHFKKYKIRAKDIKYLKRFNLFDLQIED